jgi:hypothetical protein
MDNNGNSKSQGKTAEFTPPENAIINQVSNKHMVINAFVTLFQLSVFKLKSMVQASTRLITIQYRAAKKPVKKESIK